MFKRKKKDGPPVEAAPEGAGPTGPPEGMTVEDIRALADAMLTMYAGMLVDSGPTDEAISVGAAVAWAEEVKAAWERNSGEVGSAFVVGVGIGYRLGITGTMLALELEAAQVAEMLAGIALTEGKPDVYH